MQGDLLKISWHFLFIYSFFASCYAWDNDCRIEEHNALTSRLIKTINSEESEKKILEEKQDKELKKNLHNTSKNGKKDVKKHITANS